jgi:hypothetical protein
VTFPVSIDEALGDPQLLGAALGPTDSWGAWLAVLKASFGRRLTRSEARAFAQVAGGRRAPVEPVRELWAIIGRRGGKSRVAAGLAAFLGGFPDYRDRLSPGETGYVLVLAASKAQANVVFSYALGFLESSPVLAQLIETTTQDEIRLAGNIVIGTHPNNFRTVRGRTLLACIFDEVAFWRDETTATPDVETYRAILPALATTGGPLIGISSPYRQVGLLHAKHRDHFGKSSPDVLVVRGGTEAFNPTIDRSVIARARADDPVAAAAEWDGMFRADIAQFLDDASIDAAIDRDRPLELPRRAGVDYRAFADASAGRHDAFTLCIGHQEGDSFVADVIRGRRPPFDPPKLAAEYAVLAREYGCGEITGDAYAGEWVAGAFRDARIEYRRAKLPKSGLYLEALPHFMRGAVSIPDLPPLTRELRLLERRTHRSGKDSVDHGTGGADDHANALAGCMWLAMRPQRGEELGIGAPIFVTASSDLGGSYAYDS